MIMGLRDTGYEFDTAVADILDNSIAADAKNIDLRIDMDLRGNITLSLADDGCGMNRDDLLNAMTYGAKLRPNPASLGKYGLGLKTASTAFSRRLTVASRASARAKVLAATWDLDHVADSGKWEVLLSDDVDDEIVEHLEEVAENSSGTVVVWQKVDRLLKDYADAGGKPAQKALKQKEEQLRSHLARVFQRFLDPKDKRARTVSVRLNGTAVKAWNPFLPELSELVATEDVAVETPTGKDASFSVKAYILPRREEFPTAEMAREAEISTDNQGIYIYRENRLIKDADWLGMYQKEPHANLLRIEFSFDHRLDEVFHLDIKKSQIALNEELWTWLNEQFLTAPRRMANQRYREGQKKDISKAAQGAHDASNKTIKEREAAAGGAKVNVVNPNTGECLVQNSHGQFRIKLPVAAAAKPGEVYVATVDSIENGLLFEPTIIQGHRGVRINQSHPYYAKVYVPNLNRSVLVQGMDSLMWALAVAEWSAYHDETMEHFKDMRFELSKILSKLVEGLPDPELNENAA
ncbi:ATP-binding protein [Bradyrhizobium brasilense]|uniref:ATP-binding protein n=1 Tax=Bradyrhizobium brasilense TaxID=1419277 RepID=UPI0024B213CD|nr:ATP-binding protein [Bradyrhizobium australafricanum]WFU31307.1 ATP-binding protein [Bradyrhizobium australafricanum]